MSDDTKAQLAAIIWLGPAFALMVFGRPDLGGAWGGALAGYSLSTMFGSCTNPP